MAVRQGYKYYAQVLLDLNRYGLLERLAAAENKKVTAWIRDVVYEAIRQRVSPSEYKAAEAADAALWAQAVRHRVEGRQRNKVEA
jgi:hypothetical protein